MDIQIKSSFYILKRFLEQFLKLYQYMILIKENSHRDYPKR